MRHIGNPLIWLLRFRHRRGYGVHSPFAFGFITDVVLEKLPYYSYARLDATLPPGWRLRRKKVMHLLFRLANWHRPERVVLPSGAEREWSYISAACPGAELATIPHPATCRQLVLLRQPWDEVAPLLGPGTVLVMDNLRQHRRWFRSLPSVVSFDLWDIGIAFFDTQYNKQHYIVNF